MSSETSAAAADAPPLSVSERVVWLGSLGTRLGTVRWLGELPELRAGTTVGIELVRSRSGRFTQEGYSAVVIVIAHTCRMGVVLWCPACWCPEY